MHAAKTNNARREMRNFLGLTIVILVAEPISADLPVHCLLKQIVGDWEIGFTEKVISPLICKESISNKVISSMRVKLLEGPHKDVSPGSLRYKMLNGDSISSWTSIYDSGLVFQLGPDDGRILYGNFDFEPVDKSNLNLRAGFVTADGATPGFRSLCGRISHGWVVNADKSMSCFTAKREYYLLEVMKVVPSSLRLAGIGVRNDKEFRGPWTGVEFGLPVQGSNCGSCFVFALAYALERVGTSRALAEAGQDESVAKTPLFTLDREAMLTCAYSSQGCDGGYFSALSLDISYTGAPVVGVKRSCVIKETDEGVLGKARGCDFENCFKEESGLVFTKSFRELDSEEEIMESLKRNGPVLLGVNLKAGSSMHENTDGIVVVDPIPGGPQNEGWDYINHGLVITGWGDTFWHAYNPWGYMMKIARGEDHAKLSKYATEVIVETERGFLHKYIMSSRQSAFN